nr:hypothetical protein [Saprospiraceae bacterium]
YTAFDPVAVQPERSAEQIQCPVFMAHGLADKKMNPAYSQRNFDAIPHANKALFFLEKANHQNVLSTGGQAYLDRVDRFLTTHLEDENK